MEERDVSFVIPYRSDGGWRDRLWAWCRTRLETLFPEAEIVLGDEMGKGPFLRATACNNGVQLATRPIVAILDADVAFMKQSLQKVLELMAPGRWAMGYRYKRYIAKEPTNFLLERPPDIELPSGLAVDPPYRGTERKTGGTSSYVVMFRDDFIHIGGFDARFIGWNYEDQAFAIVANTLLGRFLTTDETLVHLWHEGQPEMIAPHKHAHYSAGEELFKRYQAAEGDGEKIWSLVNERKLP